eukprot:GHVH01003798.1.p1 GENE.GHVH01003798.1~~GHVH01003798.1.p1  ORF type:complete len:717 (+),score=108.62 GHVH01003798.1:1847-3997(+)
MLYSRHLIAFICGFIFLCHGRSTGPLRPPQMALSEFGSDHTIIPNMYSHLDMLIILEHNDKDLIYSTLKSVSDPQSPQYGQFKSQDEVAAMVKLEDTKLDAIKEFFLDSLPSCEKYHMSLTKDHLLLRATAGDIQTLFGGKLGFQGQYNETHFGSDVLVGHRNLYGDSSFDDLKAELPDDIADMIEMIMFYLPEHIYNSEETGGGYYDLLDSNVCSVFDFFVRDTPLPTGDWPSLVKPYDRMNPFHAIVKADDSFTLFVLSGTRGVGDRGIIHFIATTRDGAVHVFSDDENLCTMSSEQLWKKFIQEQNDNISSIELMVVQDDVPRLLEYPFTSDFLEATCHHTCHVNGVDGSCVMFQLKFNLKPYRQTKVWARAHMKDDSHSEWTHGENNDQSFASNSIVDMSRLKDMYHMESFRTTNSYRDNLIIVSSFLEEQFDPRDTKEFLQSQNISADSLSDRLFVVGPNNPNEGRMTGVEASLDVEIIMALSPDYGVIYWNVPGRELNSGGEPFMRLVYQLSTWDGNSNNIPSILSISYGDEEVEGIDRYLKRLDREMAKLGIMGITVVAASGDDGANGMKCRDVHDVDRCTFASPSFPAGLPSVTSVGATQLSNRWTPMCHSGRVTLPPMGEMDCTSTGEVVATTEMGGSLTTWISSGISERRWISIMRVYVWQAIRLPKIIITHMGEVILTWQSSEPTCQSSWAANGLFCLARLSVPQ